MKESGIPRLGDKVKGHEIGKVAKWAWFQWCACSSCGKERWVLLLWSKPKSKRCRKCYTKEHNLNNNWNWKGGRTMCMGYVALKRPEHPRAHKGTSYVLEHILIWELSHNCSVPEGAQIHHINGIKIDNRPVNLVCLSQSRHNKEHITLTQAYQQRIRELEEVIKRLAKE